MFALCFQAPLPLLISNHRAAGHPIGLGTAEARWVKGEVCEQGCLLREPEPWFCPWPGPAVTACGAVVLRSPSGPVRLSPLALLCLSLGYSMSMEPKLAAKADLKGPFRLILTCGMKYKMIVCAEKGLGNRSL